ncbi:unnamed protein product [Polarella glacialis]|uniref:Uncharacterized protein n=1 Tax=Polarella glacialis TaxID=89957 RepID=A0A813F3M2_POLGL|nr:unnamed protein product [Polarella glacialis]
MAEPRESTVNIQQVAMRVLRTHSSKPSGVGRFVQAVDLGPWIVDDNDLKNFVLGLTSTRELHLLRSKTVHDESLTDGAWVRGETRRPGVVQDTVWGDAAARELQIEGSSALVSVRVFDRLGREVSDDQDPDWLLKSRLAELSEWQQNHGGALPCAKSSEEEELSLAQWLEAVVARAELGSLSQDAVQSLKALPGLVLGDSDVPRSLKDESPGLLKVEDTSAAKLEDLLSLQSWVQENQRFPSSASAEPSELFQNQRLRHWRKRFSGRKPYKKLTPEELQQLEAVPLINAYVTMPAQPLASAIPDLVSWVQDKQRLPSRYSAELIEQFLSMRMKTLREGLRGNRKLKKLKPKDLQLLEAVPLLQGYLTTPPTPPPLPAIPALVSWVQANQRLPSATEASEFSWHQQMRHLRKRFKCQKQFKPLTSEELQLLKAAPLIYDFVTTSLKPAILNTISALVSWVQANQRLPSRSATEPSERLVYGRLNRLRRRFSEGGTKMVPEELKLLEAAPLIHGFVTKPGKSVAPLAFAIPVLVSSVQANQRLPSRFSTEQCERAQYWRLNQLLQVFAKI